MSKNQKTEGLDNRDLKQEVLEVLRTIIHPSTKQNIVDAGFVHEHIGRDDIIMVALDFKRNDPFGKQVRLAAEKALEERFPEIPVSCYICERPKNVKPPRNPYVIKPETETRDIKNIVAITSGKGGVGKSTVTANLAIALQMMGFSVGILDADVYGPTQTKLLNATHMRPEMERIDGKDLIIPPMPYGLPLMSISMFIKQDEPVIWRGVMAHNALRQLLHETRWGKLDFLLIDMPPGTGDIHLSITGEVKLAGSVVVSTPQQVALGAVRRGINMLRHSELNVPLLGIIENMAWFTPEQHPDERYYIFGRGGCAEYADLIDVPLLGQIPIVQDIMEGGEQGFPAVFSSRVLEKQYREICEKLVESMRNNGGNFVEKY